MIGPGKEGKGRIIESVLTAEQKRLRRTIGRFGEIEVKPMPYNTWDRVAQDAEQFQAAVQKQTGCKCLIMKPGETLRI